MRLAMLQIEDRTDPAMLRMMAINKDYCEKHGIEYLVYKTWKRDTVPTYWAKTFAMRDLLPYYEGLVWMDSDAAVYDHTISFQQFFDRYLDSSFIGCPDPPQWGSPFMAGVFMVRNDEHGREIMEAWCNTFEEVRDKWVKRNGIWSCNCRWAGPDYEQGAFVKIMKDARYRSHINMLPWHTFHEFRFPVTIPGTFAVHFASDNKRNMGPFADAFEASNGKIVSTVYPSSSMRSGTTVTPFANANDSNSSTSSKSMSLLWLIVVILIILLLFWAIARV